MSCWIGVNFGLKGNALCKIKQLNSYQDSGNVELAVFINGCCSETLQLTGNQISHFVIVVNFDEYLKQTRKISQFCLQPYCHDCR